MGVEVLDCGEESVSKGQLRVVTIGGQEAEHGACRGAPFTLEVENGCSIANSLGVNISCLHDERGKGNGSGAFVPGELERGG